MKPLAFIFLCLTYSIGNDDFPHFSLTPLAFQEKHDGKLKGVGTLWFEIYETKGKITYVTFYKTDKKDKSTEMVKATIEVESVSKLPNGIWILEGKSQAAMPASIRIKNDSNHSYEITVTSAVKKVIVPLNEEGLKYYKEIDLKVNLGSSVVFEKYLSSIK